MKKINLLPDELKQRSPARFPGAGRLGDLLRRSRILGGLSLILAAAVGLLLWQGSRLWRYETGSKRLVRELAQLKQTGNRLKSEQLALNVERAKLSTVRARLEGRREYLASARQPSVPLSSVLAQLIDALPEEVWITRLVLADNSFKVTGASPHAQSAADLIASLERSKQFRDTQFVNTQRATQAAGEVFTFEINTKPVFQKAEA